MNTLQTDVAIIGGGLSGLTSASLLSEAGKQCLVVEAKSCLGGRIQSIRDAETHVVLADLGPTWVWPMFQPSVTRWIEKLELSLHAQYEEGLGVYEDGSNAAAQRLPFPGQQGIARLSGGPQALIDGFVEKLHPDIIQLNSRVTQVIKADNSYTLIINGDPETKISTKQLIVACPLRIAAKISGLQDLLGTSASQVMASAPTWMASHAKVSIVYDTAFWREEGLSGRVASRIGPLVEMHDISGETGKPAALFGFCGLPPNQREPETLKSLVLEQLVRCFGERARTPVALEIKDWAKEKYICSDLDRNGAMSHPQRLPNNIRDGYQDNTLFLSVSETSSNDPGLIAGALHAGEFTAQKILSD